MRVFSGIKPTGEPTLGTLLGAVKPFTAIQGPDVYYCIVDLHAITVQQDPDALRAASYDVAATLVAAGIDPKHTNLFAQSAVPQHPRMAWLLECVASFGELRRMTAFKDKDSKGVAVSAGLFTYPVLMAADILLYQTEVVPVGEDQKQHVELARTIARRFNQRYGDGTFTVPEPVVTRSAPRIRDLQDPTAKMSKSQESSGTITIADDPKAIRKKIARAVTDAESEVRFDPEQKPGVSNLLTIYSAVTASDPAESASAFSTYSELKEAVAEAVLGFMTPIQEQRRYLLEDAQLLDGYLAEGAAKAEPVAAATLAKAMEAMGFGTRNV